MYNYTIYHRSFVKWKNIRRWKRTWCPHQNNLNYQNSLIKIELFVMFLVLIQIYRRSQKNKAFSLIDISCLKAWKSCFFSRNFCTFDSNQLNLWKKLHGKYKPLQWSILWYIVINYIYLLVGCIKYNAVVPNKDAWFEGLKIICSKNLWVRWQCWDGKYLQI